MRALSRHWLSAVSGLLLCLGMALAADGQTNESAALVSGNNGFAFDLYSRLSEKPGNLFFSPFSISMCLGMAYAGARGYTETQMRDVLHFPDSQDAVHSSFAALQQQFNGAEKRDGIELDIANALWAAKGHSFLPAFMKTAEDDYQAEIKQASFLTRTETVRREINDWVAGKTHDKIQDILAPGSLDDYTRLLLVNAIYFNATWAVRFQTANNSSEPFYVSANSQTNAVFMRKTESVLYGENGGMQIMEIPYVGKKISMMILLPRQIDGLAGIEKQLSAAVLEGWSGQLSMSEAHIELPKFKMEARYKLNDALAKMGMTEAFDETRANFIGMDGTRNLHISEVIHHAWVDVSEEGTEAAAATVVQMRGRGLSHSRTAEFRADRPFLFLIRDRTSGTVLFIGHVANPTLP